MKMMDLPTLVATGLPRSWIVILLKFAAKCLRSHHLRRWFTREIILSRVNLLIEAISASLEQTSPHKLKTAEYAVIAAAISLILAFVPLALKYYNKQVKSTVSNQGRHEPGHHLGWELVDTFGLISSMLTLSFSSLHYYCLRNGKQQPIRISIFPLAFSVFVFCSCLFPRLMDRCRFNLEGLMNLRMEHGEDKLFACSVRGHSLHPFCYYV